MRIPNRQIVDSQLGKRRVQNLPWTGVFMHSAASKNLLGQGRTQMGYRAKRRSGFGRFAAVLLLLLSFPRAGRTQNNGLQKLFSDYYEFQLREDPGQATFLGRSEYN